MNTLVKNLNKLVVTFLQENGTDLESSWMNSQNQNSIKNLLSKIEKNKNKDPNAPKRGKSAYLFFCTANRDKVVKDMGKDAKATEITKELGVRWNKLKDDPKRKKELDVFEKNATADKVRYQKEMETYVPPPTLVKKVRTGPKRGKSAYLFFCTANREKVVKDMGNDAKATEITKELGKRWAKLKQTKKTKEFDDLAAKDKARYFKEKSEMSSEDAPAEVEAEVEAEPEAEPVETKKLSGYQLFCSEKREEYRKKHPSAKPSAVNKLLSTAWKGLSAEEQSVYKNVDVCK